MSKIEDQIGIERNLPRISSRKGVLYFFLLVLVFSIPFWILGFFERAPAWLPMNLPVSSLSTFCPLTAALILVCRESKSDGIKQLLKRSLDYARIKQKLWYIPAILLFPLLTLISYGMMLLIGRALPPFEISLVSLLTLFGVFFVAAFGEETGWMGYAFDPMQDRWGALKASVILGLFWAAIHIVPLFQTGHDLVWVAWQAFAIFVSRIPIVWLYNNTGKSVLTAILAHATSNVSESLLPVNGSFYDPALMAPIISTVAVTVVGLWGSKTLAQFRFTKRSALEVKQ